MSDRYVIEVRPAAAGITLQAGIVVREGRGFRFFAASRAFDALEGRHFDSPRTAEQAALRRITRVNASGKSGRENTPVKRAARARRDAYRAGEQTLAQGAPLAEPLDWNADPHDWNGGL